MKPTRQAGVYPTRLRSNVTWNLVGIVSYNFSQWVLLVALARSMGKFSVGQFALALAVSAPVYLTIGLHLRIVRATDVRRVWSAGQYTALRLCLNALAAAITLTIGAAVGMRGGALAVLACVCGSKAVEATSQVSYGYFQIRERLDLVARSLILRSVAGTVTFVAAAYGTGSLTLACLGLGVGWFAVYLLHDGPQQRELLRTDGQAAAAEGIDLAVGRTPTRQLARKALPLGFDAGVGSLATNIPRYGVQIFMGTGQLGMFATLAYLSQLVSFITGALGDTVVGRLAILHDRRDERQFWHLLAAVLVFGLGVTALAVFGSVVFGEWAIGAMVGPEFVNQPVFVILMIGAGFVTFQRSLARALYARQRYSSALLVNSVVLVVALATTVALVPTLHLAGAAMTLGVAFFAGTLVTAWLIVRGRRKAAEVGS